jgi:hypothetical protein
MTEMVITHKMVNTSFHNTILQAISSITSIQTVQALFPFTITYKNPINPFLMLYDFQTVEAMDTLAAQTKMSSLVGRARIANQSHKLSDMNTIISMKILNLTSTVIELKIEALYNN